MKPALCIWGESVCSTGSPISPVNLVLPVIMGIVYLLSIAKLINIIKNKSNTIEPLENFEVINMKPTLSFNLLVTFKGQKTPEAGEELLGIGEIETALGEEKVYDIKESGFYNVVLIQTESDPVEVVKLLKDYQTTVISKIVPIEMVVRTRRDLIVEKIISLCREKIKDRETFVVRGDIRGREYIKSKEELLNSITQEISEKLLLKIDDKDPDWVVQIEVIGENTGISVLKPDALIKKP